MKTFEAQFIYFVIKEVQWYQIFFPKTNYALAKSKKLHQRAVGLLGKECLLVRHSGLIFVEINHLNCLDSRERCETIFCLKKK